MNHTALRLVRPLVLALATPLLCGPLLAIPARVLAWDTDIAGRSLAIGDANKNSKIVAMHPTQRTEPYEVNTGDAPSGIVALDKKGPDGKPAVSPIKIPAGVKNPLLVILPDEKATTGIRIFVLEDDTSGFSWGTTRFINAMGKEVIFVQEKKGTSLPPSWTPIQLSPGGEDRNVGVKMFFRDQPERPIYSAVWEINSNVRKLVFLLPSEDERLGPVATKMILEDRRVIQAVNDAKQKAGKP
ncbi:hypothetical protein JIN84_19270 [Luteolibacter yonseiensis]|uniref:Uncharacterized protein n=1 Tax=Luteolibacter yonseiensis TaxID=1144680 RepID=A0A934R6B7_9BACT|nr:hypothetical protein [Luteolibacter yonseiensis]MBK1817769.1 hypothetical protein [Luteolibacter yonseiensis]